MELVLADHDLLLAAVVLPREEGYEDVLVQTHGDEVDREECLRCVSLRDGTA